MIAPLVIYPHKDECEEAAQWIEMENENEKRKQYAQELRNKGHTCVVCTCNSFPMNVIWCEQNECTEKHWDMTHYVDK